MDKLLERIGNGVRSFSSDEGKPTSQSDFHRVVMELKRANDLGLLRGFRLVRETWSGDNQVALVAVDGLSREGEAYLASRSR